MIQFIENVQNRKIHRAESRLLVASSQRGVRIGVTANEYGISLGQSLLLPLL